MNKIPLETVEYVATLSRLVLSESEARLYSDQLSEVMGFFDHLSSLDTDGVAPTTHPHDCINEFREDLTTDSLPVEKALQNSALVQGNCFSVPKVV